MSIRDSLVCCSLICVSLVGCTQTITMIQLNGKASDVVDETSSNVPSASIIPTASLSRG